MQVIPLLFDIFLLTSTIDWVANVTFLDICFESLSEFVLHLPALTYSVAEVLGDLRYAALFVHTLAHTHPNIALKVAIDINKADRAPASWAEVHDIALLLDEALTRLLHNIEGRTQDVKVTIVGANISEDDVKAYVQEIFPTTSAEAKQFSPRRK